MDVEYGAQDQGSAIDEMLRRQGIPPDVIARALGVSQQPQRQQTPAQQPPVSMAAPMNVPQGTAASAAPSTSKPPISFASQFGAEAQRGQAAVADAQKAAANIPKPGILRLLAGAGVGALAGAGTRNAERGAAAGSAFLKRSQVAAQQAVTDAQNQTAAAQGAIRTEAGLADTDAQIAERQALADKTSREQPKQEKPEDVVHAYSAALASGNVTEAERLKPLVRQFMEDTAKPTAEKPPNQKEADISDYLAAHKLADTPANRERARDAQAARSANAQAAVADARGKAYGQNRPVNVLDTWNGNRPVVVSAKDAEENPDRYVTQSAGTKAVSGKVTIDDIEGALNNLKAVTKVLDGGTINRAAIASVLADPNTTAKNFLQSGVAQTLSPDEQDYVIAVMTAREVLPGIRNILGTGQATESRVKNMLDTLPGAKTPNSEYANKQIDSALGTLKRVRPAVPDVTPKNQPAQAGALPPGWK